MRSSVVDQSQILSDPKFVAIGLNLRQLCSDGEQKLELLWAEKIGRCDTYCEGSFH